VWRRQFKTPQRTGRKAKMPKASANHKLKDYLLQIDRQSKRSSATHEAAQSAAKEIKSRFPALQVSVYDTVSGSRTAVG
jgi:hypothetical protein